MLTPSAHESMVQSLRLTLQHLAENPPVRCCLNCENFDATSQTCRRYGPIAPEHRLAEGCPTWEEQLPF